jgi:hypothetical protein
VAQVWAGDRWGAFFWPRIGHEVVVTFEEGDPDQPMIVGSVYNAENMPWFTLPANKELGGFKSASMRGKARKNFNGIVFNDEKGREHLSMHSERNLSLNSECDKMIHSGRHKGERVGIANVLTVGKLIPGGGSGGGEFSEGDPWNHPNPQGQLGINATVTYGDAFSVATPLNSGLCLGSNFQACINPFGLAAGVPGTPFPEFLHAFLGNSMGGNMQFTVGTNASLTLGQTFDISIGPPQIAIHQGYGDHIPVTILCGILAAAAFAYVLAFSLIPTYMPDPNNPQATDQDKEQSGDLVRTDTTLAYQLVVNALMTAILYAESTFDQAEWEEDDKIKEMFEVHNSVLNLPNPPNVPVTNVKPNWWRDWGALTFGGCGVLGVLGAEIALPLIED